VLPYFPFEADEFALTMNARALAVDRLIEVEPDRYRAELAEKAAILASDRRYYFQAPPGTEPPAWEAIELLLPNMARHYPQYFTLRADGDRRTWTNRLLGTEVAFTLGDPTGLPLPPLDWLGRQVQEDLLLLAGDAPGTPLVAGHLCFAAGWSLDEKVGKSFLAIHDPVPLFAERIGRSSDLLMQRLKAGHPTGRVGWSIVRDPALNHAPILAGRWRDAAPTIDATNAGERTFLRLERQTFSRLPRTRAILFTIHTYVAPLAAVIAEDAPARARRLASVLRTAPPEFLRYKGIDRFCGPLVAYLEARARESAGVGRR
jgi:dimethylamine monooxygenase subunit A